MRNIPSTRSLQIFASCVRLGSFAAAAAENSLTPSAVSHQIKMLEEEVRQTLFDRIGRNVELTAAGERYYNEVAEALGIIEQATKILRGGDTPDELNVSCVPSLGTLWLRPRLASFQKAHPELTVRLSGTPESADLADGKVDIDIRYGPVAKIQGVATEPFPNELIVVACSPATATHGNGISQPSDLVGQTLIMSELNLYGWRQWAKDHSVHLDLSRCTQFDRSLMSIATAVETRTLCLESLLLLQGEVNSGRLVLPLGITGPKISCHTLRYMRSRMHSPKIKVFRNWLYSIWSNEMD